MSDLRGVDLFAGAGGLSLGLARAGVEIKAAYDNRDAAVESYGANFDHPAYKLDLDDPGAAVEKIKEARGRPAFRSLL